jgi:hypothetical protein
MLLDLITVNESKGEDEDIDELFNTRWVPLLRKLGPQLIKLYTYCDERLVDFLKDNGCNYPVNELLFCRISPQKLNQLRNVDFLYDLNVTLKEPWEFDWLSQLTVLKKLQLDCHIYKDTDLPSLNNILANCPPSLETLMLESGTYTIQPLDIPVVNVKHLSFKTVTLPNGIDTFISQSFSQLSRLKFEQCTFERKKLILLNTNLNYFELEDTFPEENSDVEVITKNNNEKRR